MKYETGKEGHYWRCGYNLRKLKRDFFYSEEIIEELFFNGDENKLKIDTENERTFDMRVGSEVKLADFFFGNDGMNMMIIYGAVGARTFVNQLYDNEISLFVL